jgi:hypothetical protein
VSHLKISLDIPYALLYLRSVSDKLYALLVNITKGRPLRFTCFSTGHLDVIRTGIYCRCVLRPAHGGHPIKIPPVDFLLVCSGVSLRDFELNRLNMAANLRKHLIETSDQLVEAQSEALLARWLMEYRDVLLAGGHVRDLQRSFEFKPHYALPAAPGKSARRKSRNSRKEICA